MAICSVNGDTLPGNLTIIPSAQKWVFCDIYQDAFPHLYSSEVCSKNRLVCTDEDTSLFKPFESLISTTKIFNLSKVMICTFHGIQMAFKKAIFSNYGKSKYALIYGEIMFPICMQSIRIKLNRCIPTNMICSMQGTGYTNCLCTKHVYLKIKHNMKSLIGYSLLSSKRHWRNATSVKDYMRQYPSFRFSWTKNNLFLPTRPENQSPCLSMPWLHLPLDLSIVI